MIEPGEVVARVLAVAPGFGPRWEQHLATWDGAERGDFNDATELARYLVESYAAGATSEFAAVFAALEQVLESGTPAARNLVAVGVIEDLQTIASHEAFGGQVFLEWLGPRGTEMYHRIRAQWAGKQSLADVIRAERSSKGE